MRYLKLRNNYISDISPLAKLLNLEILKLVKNKIINIEALSKLNNLKKLYITNNKIINISPLSNLNISVLEISDNYIENFEPLLSLKSLILLHFRGIINGIEYYGNYHNYELKMLLNVLNNQRRKRIITEL